MKGLSASNLKYMRFFAQKYLDRRIGQQSADQLPWFHIVMLITKITDSSAREFYARESIEQSWSRETLEQHIRNQLHLRQGVAEYQLVRSLPKPLDTCLPSIKELESYLSLEFKQNKRKKSSKKVVSRKNYLQEPQDKRLLERK